VAAAPADATAPAQPLAPAVTSAPTAPAAEPDAAPVAAAESSTASRPRWWTPPWSKTTAVPVSPEAPAQAPSGPQSPAPAANLTPVADGAAPTPPAPTLLPTVPPPAAAVAAPAPAPAPSTAPPASPAAAAAAAPEPEPTLAAAATERKGWLDKLKAGLRKTGSSLATVFTGTRIDDELYEELETALLMADTGVKATEFLLADLKRRVKENKTTDPAAVKGLLADAMPTCWRPCRRCWWSATVPTTCTTASMGPP
jgi:fused signal recognition particle receptor